MEELPGCVKLQLDLEYSPLLASSPQLSPYFVFEGRYVLAPHSQLQVTRIDASQG